MFKFLPRQIAIGNNFGFLKASKSDKNDTLEFWCSMYFSHAVTTAESSRKVQMRDISLFIRFAKKEGVSERTKWTPRLSRAFKDFLRKLFKSDEQKNC